MLLLLISNKKYRRREELIFFLGEKMGKLSLPKGVNKFAFICLLLIALTSCSQGQTSSSLSMKQPIKPASAITAIPKPTTTPARIDPPLIANAGWKKLGTFPLKQTNPTDVSNIKVVPVGGQSKVLYVIHTQATTVPADEALYRSNNLGISWTAVKVPEAMTNLYTVYTDPQAPDRVLLQGGFDDNSTRKTSYISEDRGDHWQSIPLPPAFQNIAISGNAIEMRLLAGRLYVAEYWTMDLKNWTQWAPKPAEPTSLGLEINPQNPDTLFAFKQIACTHPQTDTTGYLFSLCASNDAGQSWTSIMDNLHIAGPRYSPTFCLAPDHPQNMFVWNAYDGSVLWSRDSGQTWQHLANSVWNPFFCQSTIISGGGLMTQNELPERMMYGSGKGADNAIQIGISNLGVPYHASSLDHTYWQGGPKILAGISIYQDGQGWIKVAPRPFNHTFIFQDEPKIQLFTLTDGTNMLLTWYHNDLYRYTGSLNF